MKLVVGIPRTDYNTSHHAMREKNLNSWILNIYTACMYTHKEIYSLTKLITYSLQFMYYGLRMDTHNQFRHNVCPSRYLQTRTSIALPSP